MCGRYNRAAKAGCYPRIGKDSNIISYKVIYPFCYCSGCTEGDIRLRGSANPLEGRVEVCYDGVWGTVCSQGWSVGDAAVTCRQLGYSSTGMI